jgi:hypothetical protein
MIGLEMFDIRVVGHGAHDAILKFAHIPRPVIVQQSREGFRFDVTPEGSRNVAQSPTYVMFG